MKFDILLASNFLSIDKFSDSKRERQEFIMDLYEVVFPTKKMSNT